MKNILAVLTCVLVPVAAQAWDTISFVPVPVEAKPTTNPYFPEYDALGTLMRDYSSVIDGNEISFSADVVSFDKIDDGPFRSGAVAATVDILRLASLDAKRLAAACLPQPIISKKLHDPVHGLRIPVFWQPLDGDNFRYGESCGLGLTYIQANAAKFSYSRLSSAHSAGGVRRQRMLDYISSQLTHELLHAVQAAGFGRGPECSYPDHLKWLKEGSADGFAFYLLSKRSPGVFKRNVQSRNTRAYSNPLYNDEKGTAYNSGSFFRYLVEATETGGNSNLQIVKEVIAGIQPDEARSGQDVLGALDRIVQKHSNNRPLALVYAEFLTELGSYGDRYGVPDAQWLGHSFVRVRTH